VDLNKYDYYFSETGGCECQTPEAPSRLVMGGWPARATVYQSDRVSIGYTRCRPVSDETGPETRSGMSVLIFPTRGLFRLHLRGRTHICDPNMVVLQNAADVFQTSHPDAIGDDTVWMTFSEELIADAVRPRDPEVDDRPGSPFAFPVARLESHLFLKMRSLFQEAWRGPKADGELVEETAIDLLGETMETTYAAREKLSMASRASTVRIHEEMTDIARTYMASHLHSRLTVQKIADQVYCSPFHLCRLFRSQTGLPLRKYLTSLRLRVALDRLHETKSDLAKLAKEMGFASHSHFCDIFRREFGAPPSVLRPRLRSLRSLLEMKA
jgi:AraC family transcriptional regulator